MSMPFYASAEQIMRDRSEYARKGIARGRSVAVLRYVDGIVFVAENASSALHKVSEIYDRIGFAAVGKYNEFENLRVAGIRLADMRGYSYDRRDVTARSLANAYAQTLGAIFTEQQKPYEVELCVAEVGATAAEDQIYRLSYDGTIADEPEFLVMGGQAEALTASLKRTYQKGLSLGDAVDVAVRALGSVGGENGGSRTMLATQLEVAVLDRGRQQRTFKRILGATLAALLPQPGKPSPEPAAAPEPAGEPEPGPGPESPTSAPGDPSDHGATET